MHAFNNLYAAVEKKKKTFSTRGAITYEHMHDKLNKYIIITDKYFLFRRNSTFDTIVIIFWLSRFTFKILRCNYY